TEVEQVFFVFEKLIVDSRVPIARLDIERRANQSCVAQHLLYGAAGSVNVASELVLERFETRGQSRVEIWFVAIYSLPTWLIRGSPHDVRGAQEGNGEQP